MAFLSLLDDRMKPKGSRDPLGFELIWSKLGRNVIGNLTTITGSSENFATAILGFHWANEIAGDVKGNSRVKRVRDIFLRFEQIAAYMRKHGNSDSVMGVNRVSKRLGDASLKSLKLGSSSESQILSNQVSYGLWGLYSSAMRDTKLVKGEARVPTEIGIGIAKDIEKKLDKKSFITLISQSSIRKSDIEKYSSKFMKAINSDSVQKLLLESLLMGATDEGASLQKELWEKTCDLMPEGIFDNGKKLSIALFIFNIKKQGVSMQLTKALSDIEKVERTLVIMNNIFHYCRSRHDFSLEEISNDIKNQKYDFSMLCPKLENISIPRKEITIKPIKHLIDGDYIGAINSILDLNKIVMKSRGGAAWITAPKGRLDVVVKSESRSLIPNSKLQSTWHYDYFLGSYLGMARKYANQYLLVSG